jgi:hypothetical protein
MTEVPHGFFILKNDWNIPRLNHESAFPNRFKFIYHPTILFNSLSKKGHVGFVVNEVVLG